ncbi:FAD/NAD(P)-binding protein [Nocardiopsis gilva]|uniref:FAD/NAD(P)-binding protein n=1 Tax=Nocardiopsis gilva TaxID=280236 RepID=UPI00034A5B34|nr:FAD/NAD(P)-binding protein [Nocardiopsis gilva]
MFDLAIIGGGAAGASLLVHLLNAADDAEPRIRSVAVVDPGEPGRGLAFARPEPYVLCNTSVAVNTVNPTDPAHFERWLRSHPDRCHQWGWTCTDVHPSAFVPRGLYSDYLADQLHAALRRGRQRGIGVDHIRACATSIHTEDSGTVIHTPRGRTIRARRAVVCSGLGTSSATAHREAAADGLLRAVYDIPSYREFVPATGTVVVLGTRQSAVDAALLVAGTQPDVRIAMMSPSGRFPAARTSMVEVPGEWFTTDHLLAAGSAAPGELVRRWAMLLRAEGAPHAAVERAPRHADLDGVDLLADDLARTTAGRQAWEIVVPNALTVANEVWPTMAPAQRAAIRQAFTGLLRRYAAALPARNAERICHLAEEGRLWVTRGPRRWRRTRRHLEFEDAEGRVIRADRAVDATGLTAFGRVRGLAVEGRSLQAAAAAVDPVSLEAAPGIHLLGPPLGDTFAVNNYANATHRQAARLAEHLTAGNDANRYRGAQAW